MLHQYYSAFSKQEFQGIQEFDTKKTTFPDFTFINYNYAICQFYLRIYNLNYGSE